MLYLELHQLRRRPGPEAGDDVPVVPAHVARHRAVEGGRQANGVPHGVLHQGPGGGKKTNFHEFRRIIQILNFASILPAGVGGAAHEYGPLEEACVFEEKGESV